MSRNREPRTEQIIDDVERQANEIFSQIEKSLSTPYNITQAKHDYGRLLVQMDMLDKVLERDKTRFVTPDAKGKSAEDICDASIKAKAKADDQHAKISQASQAVLRGLSRQSKLS